MIKQCRLRRMSHRDDKSGLDGLVWDWKSLTAPWMFIKSLIHAIRTLLKAPDLMFNFKML